MGLFILATPRSGPEDLAENVDMVIRSIGAGAIAGIGAYTGRGHNRLSEEYSAPNLVKAEIRPIAEEYLQCLDSWLEREDLSSAFSKRERSKETLEKICSILGETDQGKKSQILSLKSALEVLRNLCIGATE